MKLGFNNLNTNDGVRIDDDILTFTCVLPIVIQSGEIQKVKIGTIIEVEKGYVLNISTAIGLAEKAGEIFPAYITLDHTYSGELFLPVRNNGRNQLNLMQGIAIAQGYISKVQKIEPYVLDALSIAESTRTKTTPQKKNTNFKFEVR